MAGCKKKDVIKNTDTGTGNTGYYFQYTLDGSSALFNGQQLQLGATAYNTLVGLVPGNSSNPDAGGITVNFGNDTATAANVLALAGKKFNFNQNVYPQLSVEILTGSYNYTNLPTNDTTYLATISGVSFLQYDTSAGFDIYVVKGTFSAKLWNVSGSGAVTDTIGDATDGSFNIQCTVNHNQ